MQQLYRPALSRTCNLFNTVSSALRTKDIKIYTYVYILLLLYDGLYILKKKTKFFAGNRLQFFISLLHPCFFMVYLYLK